MAPIVEILGNRRYRVPPAAPALPDALPVNDREPSRPPRFLAVRFDAASLILEDGATFSAQVSPPLVDLITGTTMLQMDAPAHAQKAQLFRPLFSPARIAHWERTVIRPLAHQLLDELGGAIRDPIDLVSAYTAELPLHTINRIVGLPERERTQLHTWPSTLCGNLAADQVAAIAIEINTQIRRAIDARRDSPSGDLLGEVLRLHADGAPLPILEVLAFIRLLVGAAYETASHGLATALFALLSHPSQLVAVRRDPGLIAPAVEEALRWETSDPGVSRRATRDTELCGIHIPAGTRIEVSLASANHDETRWEQPENFDLHRPQKRHLAFGAGAHHCLGARLGRAELSVGIEVLLERLPHLAIDPAWTDRRITGSEFRAPEQLPVVRA